MMQTQLTNRRQIQIAHRVAEDVWGDEPSWLEKKIARHHVRLANDVALKYVEYNKQGYYLASHEDFINEIAVQSVLEHVDGNGEYKPPVRLVKEDVIWSRTYSRAIDDHERSVLKKP